MFWTCNIVQHSNNFCVKETHPLVEDSTFVPLQQAFKDWAEYKCQISHRSSN